MGYINWPGETDVSCTKERSSGVARRRRRRVWGKLTERSVWTAESMNELRDDRRKRGQDEDCDQQQTDDEENAIPSTPCP
jgi:hypothetical protein